MLRICYCAAALLLLLSAGCGRQPHPPPPLENSSLLLRMFDNLARNNSEVAAEQALKLRTQLPDNAYLGKILNTQRANSYVTRAARDLAEGKLDSAIRRVDDGLIRYPLNRSLRETRLELETLKSLRDAAQLIENADSLEELESGLNQLRQALRTLPQRSKLHRLLPLGRQRVQMLRESDPVWRFRTSPLPLLDATGLGTAMRSAGLTLRFPVPPETR